MICLGMMNAIMIFVRQNVVMITNLPHVSTEKEREMEEAFDKFWSIYPRRVGKRAAQLKFRKACERASISDIMKGLKKAVIRFRDTEPQFIPHPATWLHQDRWLDEPEKPKKPCWML